MFIGFNLILKPEHILNDLFYEKGIGIYKSQKAYVENNLKKFICEDGYINATQLQENWFPQMNADVFLSHSHKDEKLVISFAGWLNEIFGLTSFIDSCVWGYANNLIKIIDNKYCVHSYKDDGSVDRYNYTSRNYSTSHVHMMLNMAIAKMIDSCECLMFVNTPSSIILEEGINKPSTISPWIYSELEFSRIIRHRNLQEYRADIKKGVYELSESLKMKYDVSLSLSKLRELNGNDLQWMWQNARKNLVRIPLDELYEYLAVLPKIAQE